VLNKVRAWAIVGLFALAAAAGCVSRRLTGPEVVSLAQQVLHQERASHYTLDIELSTDLIRDQLVVEVWEAPPDHLELRVLDASTMQLAGLAFATDGVRSVSYLPHTNEAVVGPAELVKMPSVLASLVSSRRDWVLAIEAAKARVVGRERRQGLLLYRIEAALGTSGSAQFWFDSQDWLVRQIVYQDEHLGTGTIYVRDLTSSDRATEIDLELPLPAGVPTRTVAPEQSRTYSYEEAQRGVGYRLRIPTALPPETHLAWAFQSEQSVTFVYEGREPFRITQQPDMGFELLVEGTLVPVRGYQGTLVKQEMDGVLTLVWREDGLRFSISGSLGENEVMRIAESLQ